MATQAENKAEIYNRFFSTGINPVSIGKFLEEDFDACPMPLMWPREERVYMFEDNSGISINPAISGNDFKVIDFN